MGNKLFGVDIAKELASGFKKAGGLRPLTLRKFTKGTATVGSLTAGTNDTPVEHTGQGFEEVMSIRERASLVKGASAKLSILGDSLPAGVIPEANDEVDLDGTTYTLMVGGSDPAAALYTFQSSA